MRDNERALWDGDQINVSNDLIDAGRKQHCPCRAGVGGETSSKRESGEHDAVIRLHEF